MIWSLIFRICFTLCIGWYHLLLILFLCDYIIGCLCPQIHYLICHIHHHCAFDHCCQVLMAYLWYNAHFCVYHYLKYQFSNYFSFFCFFFFFHLTFASVPTSLDWSEIKLLLLLSFFFGWFLPHLLPCHLLWIVLKKALIIIIYWLWKAFIIIIFWLWKEAILIVFFTYYHWIRRNTWLRCIVCIALMYTSASHLLFVQLPDFLPSACTVHQHPACCLYTFQASYLLFELLFHFAMLSAFCLDYHLMPTPCLLFHSLMLGQPESLNLQCLTIQGHYLALQQTYIPFVFLYALMWYNRFPAACLLYYCIF